MKKTLLSSLTAAALAVSLTMSATAAPGFVGSIFNSDNGVAISQEESRKPAVKKENGESKPLTVIVSQGSEDGTAVTQEERGNILKKAESTIMITQSPVVTSLLESYMSQETDEETTAAAALEELVKNGISVEDAVKTVTMSNAVLKSSSVSEALDALSEELKSQVQEDAKGKSAELQKTTRDTFGAMEKALEIAKGQVQADNELIDIEAVKEALAAEDAAQAALFEKTVEKLTQKNVEITPETLEKVLNNLEKRQEVLEEIEAGNVDHMKVHSVFDISVSDDIKAAVSEEGSYVEASVELPGVDEDTLVVAVKPVETAEGTLTEAEAFEAMQETVNNGNAKELFSMLGNSFTVLDCTTYDGGVTLEMPSFSPVMILTYADQTADLDYAADTTAEDAVPEKPSAEEEVSALAEPAESGNGGLTVAVIVVIVAALIGGVVLYKNKKNKNDTTKN